MVIAGVFSPLDADHLQEEQVGQIIQEHFPSLQTVLSKHVSNIGLLERENASILNACLLNYAHTVVQEFQEASEALNLTCPVMVTSNDGTLLSCYQASVLPIRTFSSGPTNSMRGAAFCASRLTGRPSKETALVVDIGGTTVGTERTLIVILQLTPVWLDRRKWVYFCQVAFPGKLAPTPSYAESASSFRCPR